MTQNLTENRVQGWEESQGREGAPDLAPHGLWSNTERVVLC